MTIHPKAISSVLLALGLLMSSPLSQADTQMQQRITAQMAKPDRHEFDLPRDAGRKPYETFLFLGVTEGMTTLDYGAFAGYTTEMLAAAVGPSGKVYSHNTQRVLEKFADGYYQRTMDERLANDRLPNTKMHIADYDDIGLNGQIDVAFVGNLLHDFYHQGGREQAIQYLRAIRQTLKPNGVLGITDHIGLAGQDNASLHRMQASTAVALLTEAGFTVTAQSDLFTNPADDHLLMVYDETIYLHTDRFFFKAMPAE
jgi:predicted methyltransferase